MTIAVTAASQAIRLVSVDAAVRRPRTVDDASRPRRAGAEAGEAAGDPEEPQEGEDEKDDLPPVAAEERRRRRRDDGPQGEFQGEDRPQNPCGGIDPRTNLAPGGPSLPPNDQGRPNPPTGGRFPAPAVLSGLASRRNAGPGGGRSRDRGQRDDDHRPRTLETADLKFGSDALGVFPHDGQPEPAAAG